jgi:hypothetical protein
VRLPEIHADIERRLLVNYRVDPDTASRLLPAPFRPQLVNGSAVAGICLIRLGALRPAGLPHWAGVRSENAAHRIAVEWDTPDGARTGVYIPRRDTDAVLNAALGGRLYPGEQHRARFFVRESGGDVHVDYASYDGSTRVSVDVRIADQLDGSALFSDVDAASRFFERGSIGLSATRDPYRLDGMQLETDAWAVDAGHVSAATSSFFDDPGLFPPGSAVLDCALVMRQVPVRWKALPAYSCSN